MRRIIHRRDLVADDARYAGEDAGQVHVGGDHHGNESREVDLAVPPQNLVGLGRITDEEVDFGRA